MTDFSALHFDVLSIAAWSPGLTNLDDWLSWAHEPVPLRVDGVPDVSRVPAGLRRRLDRRGKMALFTTFEVDPGADASTYVFATPLGEVQRSAEILDANSRHEPVSPSTFASSVHNAIGASYSIARGVRAPVVATSAGDDTAATAIIEALAAQVDVAQERPGADDAAGDVVVTYFDDVMPTVYAGRGVPSRGPYSWSIRLRGKGGTFGLVQGGDRLLQTAEDDPGLTALRFLLGAIPRATTGTWLWCRCG
ncbi:MAG: beta-ketoacyl synthase chain length factor [Myxococcales bacterium]|nr:beta-ketoacyl synthase chain length factor [Myxococcales bacterium]